LPNHSPTFSISFSVIADLSLLIISIFCSHSVDCREDRVLLEMNVEDAFQYPAVSPKVRLWQPRGVDEKNVNELNRQVDVFVSNNLDMPILYDIFRVCVICVSCCTRRE
uniref:RWD domain-containing protein n=1 Tax=Parascaris equorum TaxID=6256 RepID=A0A914R7Z1_PAREQ